MEERHQCSSCAYYRYYRFAVSSVCRKDGKEKAVSPLAEKDCWVAEVVDGRPVRPPKVMKKKEEGEKKTRCKKKPNPKAEAAYADPNFYRRCSKCGRMLHATAFAANAVGKDGLRSDCRECNAKYAAIRRKTDISKVSM